MGSAIRRPIRSTGRPANEADLRFVEDYLKYGNATRAYHAAGFNGKSPGTNALKMLKKAGIQSLLRRANDNVTRRLERKLEITREKVIGDLEEARVGALGALQFAAAIKASELHGRDIGMFNDDRRRDEESPTIVIKSGDGTQIAIVGRSMAAQLPLTPLPEWKKVEEVHTEEEHWDMRLRTHTPSDVEVLTSEDILSSPA